MKDIPGYEGLYAATEDGQIWGYKRKKFLKPIKEWTGYLKVNLSKGGKVKAYKLHRLILETFCPIESEKKMEVNHKDENKENNSLDNLEWISHGANCNYGTRNQRIKEHNIETKKGA